MSQMRRSRWSLSMWTVALIFLIVAGNAEAACPNPFEDPKNDVCNPYRYIPHKVGNVTGTVLFFISSALLTGCYIHRPIKWFLVLVIGAWTYAIGMALRFGMRHDPQNLDFIIASSLLVVLSPCAYLAAMYILLGKITVQLDGAKYLRPFEPRSVGKFFVWSDVITFQIQSAGNSLFTLKNKKLSDVGKWIIVTGLLLQLISFIVFACLVAIFYVRVWKEDSHLFHQGGWRRLYWALIFTCVMMLARCVFRVIEFIQEAPGSLNTHEVYFFFLDALPMWLVISTFIPFWPARWINIPSPNGATDYAFQRATAKIKSPRDRGVQIEGGTDTDWVRMNDMREGDYQDQHMGQDSRKSELRELIDVKSNKHRKRQGKKGDRDHLDMTGQPDPCEPQGIHSPSP
ncbi:hypothetical protein IAT40_005326 [Kwoniella sp. CBS 6097]